MRIDFEKGLVDGEKCSFFKVYTPVFSALMADERLLLEEKMCYLILTSFADFKRGKSIYICISHLSKVMNKSSRTISRYLSSLKETGWLNDGRIDMPNIICVSQKVSELKVKTINTSKPSIDSMSLSPIANGVTSVTSSVTCVTDEDPKPLSPMTYITEPVLTKDKNNKPAQDADGLLSPSLEIGSVDTQVGNEDSSAVAQEMINLSKMLGIKKLAVCAKKIQGTSTDVDTRLIDQATPLKKTKEKESSFKPKYDDPSIIKLNKVQPVTIKHPMSYLKKAVEKRFPHSKQQSSQIFDQIKFAIAQPYFAQMGDVGKAINVCLKKIDQGLWKTPYHFG